MSNKSSLNSNGQELILLKEKSFFSKIIILDSEVYSDDDVFLSLEYKSKNSNEINNGNDIIMMVVNKMHNSNENSCENSNMMIIVMMMTMKLMKIVTKSI